MPRALSLSRRLAPALVLTCAALAQGAVVTPNGTPDPAYPNLWAWYDAAVGPNSSAVPLPDGTPLTSWDDRSVQARHLTRLSVDPLRAPTAADDLRSCGPAIRFDGDDYIWASTADIGRCAGPRTIFAVVRVDVADGGYVFDGSTSTGRTTLHSGQTATPATWHVWWGDTSQVTPNGYLMVSAPVDEGRYQFHTVRIEPNRQEHWINGQLVMATTEPLDFNLGGLILGARYNTANALTGDIKEILIYQESLNPVDQALIETYLAGRHPYGFATAYGSGCAGSSGAAPELAAAGCPSPGYTLELQLTSAPASAPSVVNFALARSALPIGPCTILAAPVLVAVGGVADPAGRFAVRLTVPTGLAQFVLTTQALVVDPGAVPFGVTVSNGVELRVF